MFRSNNYQKKMHISVKFMKSLFCLLIGADLALNTSLSLIEYFITFKR